MKRLLLTGATGFVGQRLCRDLGVRYKLLGTHHGSFRETPDVTPVFFEAENDSPEDLVAETEPDAIVHCLAISSAAECARDPERAHKVNVEVTARLAAAAKKHRIRMIFTSTDQVFDGKRGDYVEEDAPHPVGVYARTKVDAEKVLWRVFEGCEELLTIFRLALSYGWSDDAHPGPVGWILKNLERGEPVTLFRDEIRSPLYVGDISRAVADSIEFDRSGLYHLAGRDKMDRHTMGVLIADRFGFDRSLCLSRSVADHTGPEPRSPDCSMMSDRFEKVFGWRPVGVEEGLRRMEEERIVDDG
jgi:dTDP-4-dehydrorhamnose reductase